MKMARPIPHVVMAGLDPACIALCPNIQCETAYISACYIDVMREISMKNLAF
jgi:hypothetical protein